MADYDLSSLTVLVVEKHVYMRRILRDILHELGISNIREAESADAAFDMFVEDPVDLVLTDWSPRVDGLNLVQRLRLDPESLDPYVAIVVLTAHTEVTRVCEARDAGMTEFLAKPISAKLLYYRIRSIIERQRMFVRADDFFGPDRRRRRADFNGADRRAHRNVSGQDRRQRQVPHGGPERRQGYPGYTSQDNRNNGRSPLM